MTVTLPPGPTAPRVVQAAYALSVPHRGVRRMRERFGDAFTVNVPIFGRALVISDPAEVRQVFRTGPEVIDNHSRNLGRVLGPGSLFALRGEDHRIQRKLLTPPFHGRRLSAYERIVEEETERETASWPQGRPFPTLPSTTRITLNVILRAVFGADNGLHWDVLAMRLARQFPQRYADATAESVSAACRGRGVPSADVRFPAGIGRLRRYRLGGARRFVRANVVAPSPLGPASIFWPRLCGGFSCDLGCR